MKSILKKYCTKQTLLLAVAFAAGALAGAVLTWVFMEKTEYTLIITDNKNNGKNPLIQAIEDAEKENNSAGKKHNPELLETNKDARSGKL